MHYDFHKLIGRWLRPDGGYVIDIRKIHADGKMDAGYYNPQPINVSRAELLGRMQELSFLLSCGMLDIPDQLIP